MERLDEIGSPWGFLEDFAVGRVDLDFYSGFECEFCEALGGADIDSFDLAPVLDAELGVLLEGLEHLLGADS